MENTQKGRLSRRNLYLFSIAGFGRDMCLYGFFINYILNYVYFTKTLNTAQFAFITLFVALEKIFDAINDVIMGNIMDGTKSKMGKFKPWILTGMIGCAVIILLSFNCNLSGWGYVAFFCAMYLLFDVFFTMNDTAYWGYLPALGREESDRSKITSRATFFASIGGTICGLVTPLITTGSFALGGNAIMGYRFTSITYVILLFIFQSLTLFVKEDEVSEEVKVNDEDKVTFKETFKVLKKNDQLRYAILPYLLTQMVPSTCISMFLYFQFGYEGLFGVALYALSTVVGLLINLFFPKLTKKFGRKKMMNLAFFSALIGYSLFIIFYLIIPKDIVAFSAFGLTIKLQFLLMCVAQMFVGYGSTSSYLTFIVSIANTCEYNELISGKRNEGVIFSTRAFCVKLGSAFNTFLAMGFYLLIGVYNVTNGISQFENQASQKLISDVEKTEGIKNLLASVPDGKTFALLALTCVFGIILYFISNLIYQKKYKLDEANYSKVLEDLRNKK